MGLRRLALGLLVAACGTSTPPDAVPAPSVTDAAPPRDSRPVTTGDLGVPVIAVDAAADGAAPADGVASVDAGIWPSPDGAVDRSATEVHGPEVAGPRHPLTGRGAVETVSSGHRFTEGPVWIGALQPPALLFTDQRILRLPAAGAPVTFRDTGVKVNGLAVDTHGRIWACEEGARRVAQLDADGKTLKSWDRWSGGGFSGPNDIVVRDDGQVYFTDFKGGRIFRITPAGVVELVATEEGWPNGIALAPDGRTLYVSLTLTMKIRAYPVRADGSTAAGRDFASPGLYLDGIAIDDGGHLYVAAGDDSRGVREILVYDARGTRVGTIPLSNAGPTNLAFGDTDRRTLYITGGSLLRKVRMPIPGRP